MKRTLIALSPLLFLLSACNPSLIKAGDPLYGYVEGGEFWLAHPVTGKYLEHQNLFKAAPHIAGGSKVQVVAIERAQPEYRITFKVEGHCKGSCVAYWRSGDDAGFKARFEGTFLSADPTADYDEEMRQLIASHQVSSKMDEAQVRLTLGVPDLTEETEDEDGNPATRWVYERHGVDEDQNPIATPELALYWTDGALSNFEQIEDAESRPIEETKIIEPER